MVRERTQGLQEALAKQSELASKNAQAYELVRRTQEELVRQERLAAVGEVAAAVAHGIRNPLASIRAAAEVRRDELLEDGYIAETLDDVIAEVTRLDHRIRTVLDFAHPFEAHLTLEDPNEVLRGFVSVIRNRVPETVKLDIELDPSVPSTLFDSTLMNEVMEAFVINAIEAMEGKGRVTVRSALERDSYGGEHAILSVEDSGPGIEPDRIERIFDLFYTSKPSGTGIGLALANRLVKCQGGRIDVQSLPAKTTFFVRLPIRQRLEEQEA